MSAGVAGTNRGVGPLEVKQVALGFLLLLRRLCKSTRGEHHLPHCTLPEILLMLDLRQCTCRPGGSATKAKEQWKQSGSKLVWLRNSKGTVAPPLTLNRENRERT